MTLDAGRWQVGDTAGTPHGSARHASAPPNRDSQFLVKRGCVSLMSGWTDNELARIGAADELEIAPYRRDGTLRPYTTIWVLRVGEDLYVRSWRGRRGAWFRRALQRHEGRIQAGGIERDVTFSEPDDSVHPAIDQVYRTKYGRYGNPYVQPMIDADATAATLRLGPR